MAGAQVCDPRHADPWWGSIIITSSTAGIRGGQGMSPYTTSKHAVIGLMRAAAQECAPLGIRVNTVNPAATETRMMRSIEEMRTSAAGGAVTVEQVKRRTASRIPLQRYGAPEEVARMMLYLASDESSFCRGCVYGRWGNVCRSLLRCVGGSRESPRASSAK